MQNHKKDEERQTVYQNIIFRKLFRSILIMFILHTSVVSP